METVHVTDEQVQKARIEDALRDVAQRLMSLGLPIAINAMPEINRLLACQETHSAIYVGFSNQNRMFGDDIATLRIFADVNFRQVGLDTAGNEYTIEMLTFSVETRQFLRPGPEAVEHAQAYLQVAIFAADMTRLYTGKPLYRLYQTAETRREAENKAKQQRVKRWIEDGAASGLRFGQTRIVQKTDLPTGKYLIELESRSFVVNVYEDGSGVFIRRTR